MDRLETKKRFTKGFVLGKFMPPHNGHLHLIRSAAEQCEQLTVLVCSVKREPIPGELRYEWMQQLVQNARLIHVTDEVPSYPHESADFWTIWRELLLREIEPGTQVFFSSEDYGEEVAELLGIEHVMIDRKREIVPVSASLIRENPFHYWDFIPTCVRPYFVKKVVLTGPESTGKTTLAQHLAEHFQTNWVPEFGRDYFAEKNGQLVREDYLKIVEGQLQSESEAIREANRWLFCDTDPIVTQIWAEIYEGSCPMEVVEASNKQEYSFYLLMNIDIPWVNDGTREFPHLRQWHFERIRAELINRKLPFELISGDFDSRFNQACTILETISRFASCETAISFPPV